MMAMAAALVAFAPGAATAGQTGHKVVVELFTSQGCSSCPPADAYVGELAKRDDVIALSFHVDYWNYIGWSDPFSSPQWTKRQQSYGKSLRRGYIYTPQMVIDGELQGAGSRRGQIELLIRGARSRPKLEIEVSHPDRDSVRIRIPAAAGRVGKPATIWLAFYDASHTTIIRAGENDGVTLTNTNVVRSMNPVGTWDGKAKELTLGLADLGAEGRDGCAILVQERNTGRILGAAAFPLMRQASN